MASKSTKSTNFAEGNMQFIGPAQQPFGSFVELARFTLNTYWPKWNDQFNPSNYISPPTFSFKNPDKSDLNIDTEKNILDQTKQQNCATQQELSLQERPIIDRRSDYGEYLIFQVLWKMVQENVQAPFLAVRGLDLEKLKDYLQQIFAHVQPVIQGRFTKMMREHDFVLIGPRIGIIVIEVKSSNFTKGKDFAPTNNNLPEQIVDAVKQLNSFDLEFFHECAGQKHLGVPVRKILFTQNLEKHRFKRWYDNLEQIAKGKVDNCLNKITHWFMDDMANLGSDSLKPPLYSTIRQMLEADGFQLPNEVYELYGPMIVGLGSAWVIKSHQSLEIIQTHLLTSNAILSDAAALDSQDPRGILKSATKRQMTDEKSKLTLSSKMVLLTPEQQKALNGPNYQFLIGAAGTGKTIILQAKALEMLGKGKRVLVMATRNFGQRYRKLFDDHGLRNYKVKNINDLGSRIFFRFNLRHEFAFVNNDSGKPVKEIFDHLISISDTYTMQQLLESISIMNFDAIFIDDAIDKAEQGAISADHQDNLLLLYALFAAMAGGKVHYGSKMLWIALDPFLNPEPSIHGRRSFSSIKKGRLYRRILEQMTQLDTDHFSYSCLQQVMRCSESVFQSAYRLEILGQTVVKPKIGHKIPGFSDSVSLSFSEGDASSSFTGPWSIQIRILWNDTQIELVCWKHIKLALDRFHEEGFTFGQMAILTGSVGYDGGDGLARYISNKCTQCLIPIISDVHLFSSEAAVGKLVVSSWHSVSSLEWPVVIYVSVAGKNNYDDDDEQFELLSKDYQRYRACSRATMRLFQVIVHYDMRKGSWEADIRKGKTGRYTMAPVEEKATEDLHVSNMSETADQLALYSTERPGNQNDFWKRTWRRCFSVHNLDLSTIPVESETFKDERDNIEDRMTSAFKSRLDSVFRSVEKQVGRSSFGDVPIIDKEMECASQKSSEQNSNHYGLLIEETSLGLPEKRRIIFEHFWKEQLANYTFGMSGISGNWHENETTLGELTNLFLTDQSDEDEELHYWQRFIVKFCSLISDDMRNGWI